MVAEPSPDGRDTLLIQFAKSPVPGQVKTRMMPYLSAGEAASLHCELLLWTCRHLCASGIGAVELWVSGRPEHEALQQCREFGVAGIHAQIGGDLERRCGRLFAADAG